MKELSTLLHFGYGINWHHPGKRGLHRHVPTAGGLFPMELYLLATRLETQVPGALFHYHARTHSIELIARAGDAAAEAALVQPEAASAAIVLFISGCLPRLFWKYGDRGYRYLFLEAGHIAQDVCLCAEAVGLRACPIAGYYDDAVHDLLWLDGVSEFVVYALCIGA